MISILKLIQLTVSIGVTVSILLIYPGVMAFFASTVGFCYVFAALAALRNNLVGIWLGFLFSALTTILSLVGVSRFLSSGFNFLAGSWESNGEFNFVPYLFLIISLLSSSVVVLHVVSWKWMTHC
jgi:hypothetical protein